MCLLSTLPPASEGGDLIEHLLPLTEVNSERLGTLHPWRVAMAHNLIREAGLHWEN